MKPANGFDKRPNDINRSGRPKKGESLTDILEEYGEKTGNKLANKEALADTLWKLAIEEKDIQAIKFIYDRVDGKPLQQIEAHIDKDIIVDREYINEDND